MLPTGLVIAGATLELIDLLFGAPEGTESKLGAGGDVSYDTETRRTIACQQPGSDRPQVSV